MAVDKTLKVKKKKWVSILAPELFKNEQIGETFSAEPKDLPGKFVKISLMQLLRDPKRQSMTLSFKIKEVVDGRAQTEVVAYSMLPAAIKRLVRRRRDKLEDSFLCVTKDKRKVRIKPLMLTFSNTSNLIQAKLRRTARDILIRKARKLSFEELISEVVSNKLQNDLKKDLKKIHPLRIIDVKYVGLEFRKRNLKKDAKRKQDDSSSEEAEQDEQSDVEAGEDEESQEAEEGVSEKDSSGSAESQQDSEDSEAEEDEDSEKSVKSKD